VKRTTGVLIICVVLIVLGGLYYFNKEETVTPESKASVEKAATDIVFEGGAIVERKGGQKLWELSADAINVDPTSQKVLFDNLRGTLYQSGGGELRITARTASFDNNTRELSMDGDIKAVSTDGAEFTAVKAQWVGKEDKIYASGGITLSRGDTVITGNQLESDSKLVKVKILGNAHVSKKEE